MNENDGSGFLPHECVFRKLASERLDRVTELAGDLAEVREERDAAQAAANKLIAELATVRAERDMISRDRNGLRDEINEEWRPDVKSLEAELVTTRAALSTLEQAAREAVAMYDRYCLHDMTIDEHDLGKTLEGVRLALERALNEVSK